MSFQRTIRIPDLKLHKGKNRMYVSVGGKFRYFGKPDDPGTRQRYENFCQEWKRTGSIPRNENTDARPAPKAQDAATVGEVVNRYKTHPENLPIHPYMAIALREIDAYCGAFPAADLTPKVLKNFLTGLAERRDARGDGGSRSHFSHTTIRQVLQCVKAVYRWGTVEEFIPAEVWTALTAVAAPRVDRSGARPPRKVLPVSDEVVQKTVAMLPHTVAAIVRLLDITGARPSEVLTLKCGDIDRTDPQCGGPGAPAVWRAVLEHHKTAHRGQQRVLHFGPAAQAVLAPFLFRAPDEYLFKPIEAMRQARAGCKGRHQPVRPPKTPRRVRDCYDIAGLRHAIRRAAEKAGVPDWHPYQLRHAAATRIRREMGLDTAAKVLGHNHVATTEVYAELSDAKARDAALRLG